MNSLREELIKQHNKDEKYCSELTKIVLDTIQSTKVIENIKNSLQQQFDKYFAEAKKLFFRTHQIKIINTFQNKKLIEFDINKILDEDFFYINIPLNYCERKAQKLADICRRIALASSLSNNDEQVKFKMIVISFFSTINIDIDLEKEDECDFIDDIMNEGQYCQSNSVIFSNNQ